MAESKQIALLDAVVSNDIAGVQKALSDGADPAVPLAADDYLPWYYRKYRFANLLHEPWAKDNERKRGLGFHIVFESRSYEIFKLLINKGVCLEAVDRRYETSILHHCLAWGPFWAMDDGNAYRWDIHRRFKMLALLLETGVDVDIRDPKSGRTALQSACADKDDGAVISLFLKHGASVQAAAGNGDTALHFAACHYPKWPLDKSRGLDMLEPWGAREAVEALILAGADPNAYNPRNGFTPMHWASVHEQPPYIECLEALYKFGGKVSLPNRAGRRPVDFPVPENDEKAALLKQEFIRAAQREAQENTAARAVEQLASYAFESPQVMMWDAVFHNDAGSLKAALEAGAEVNSPLTVDEYKAWLYRVHADVLLVELASIDDDQPEAKFYVIYLALNYPQLLKLILEAGAKTSVINGELGNRPLLHYYIHCSTYGIVGDGDGWPSLICLLEAGVDVDMRDDKGRTALQQACWDKMDGTLISILLRYGASVTAMDNDGDTALHGAGFHDEWYKCWPLDSLDEYEPDESEMCQAWGAKEAVNALVDAGADPNAVNPNNGFTPMHWAMQHGDAYLPFLEALFERGGRVDIASHEGLRPIDFFYDSPKGDALRKRFEKFLEQDKAQKEGTASMFTALPR